MKIVIIEDEPIAVQRLTNMLQQIDTNIKIVMVLESVDSSIRYFKAAPPVDLIFMDVELGDGQSFEIFDSANINAPIVFITAYQRHAIKAFKQNSIDYLLKPLSRAELEAALYKYKRTYSNASESLPKASMDEVGKMVYYQNQKKRFLTRVGTKLTSVPAENIAYFYTKDKLQYIKTKKSEDLLYDKRLEEVEAEMDNQRFFRVNRQFIINYDAIEKVYAWFGGKLKLHVAPAPYEDIIISRLKATEFKKWLGE